MHSTLKQLPSQIPREGVLQRKKKYVLLVPIIFLFCLLSYFHRSNELVKFQECVLPGKKKNPGECTPGKEKEWPFFLICSFVFSSMIFWLHIIICLVGEPSLENLHFVTVSFFFAPYFY